MSDGKPIVAYLYAPTYLYLCQFSGSTWIEISYPIGVNEVAFALYNGSTPYFMGSDNYGTLLNYSSSWNTLTNLGASGVIAPSMDILSSTMNLAAYINGSYGTIYEINLSTLSISSSNFDSGGSITKAVVKNAGSRIYLAYLKGNSLYIKSGISYDSVAIDAGILIDPNASQFAMTVNNGKAYIVFKRGSEFALQTYSYDGVSTNYLGYITNTNANMVGSPAIAAGNNAIYAACTMDSMQYIRVFSYNGTVWNQIGSDLDQGMNLSMDVKPVHRPALYSLSGYDKRQFDQRPDL